MAEPTPAPSSTAASATAAFTTAAPATVASATVASVKAVPARQPVVVVVGAGFGGLSAVLALKGAGVRIVVIDQRNHHLFQPLLYQVATAALSPSEIASPIRSIVGRLPDVEVILGRVFGVDTGRRVVQVEDTATREIGYDYLVMATGSHSFYFGNDSWMLSAPGLKTVEDATVIRQEVLLAFERAETEQDPEERARLLTFVVIGGGPTGVEMAGSIIELAHRILAPDFHTINARSARVILVEGGPRLLPSFPENLSAYTARSLTRLGVEIRTNTLVTTIQPDHVGVKGGRIQTRTAIWAAGVRASDAATWLSAEADRGGRVKVTPELTLPGHPEVFVIGDTALVLNKDGTPVPGVAPAAKQQGKYVAEALRAKLAGKEIVPFRYRNLGNLATIGRRSAVIEFGRWHLTGFIAWLLWGVAHIFFLIGFRNRIVVMVDWIWAYLWYSGGARLITGVDKRYQTHEAGSPQQSDLAGQGLGPPEAGSSRDTPGTGTGPAAASPSGNAGIASHAATAHTGSVAGNAAPAHAGSGAGNAAPAHGGQIAGNAARVIATGDGTTPDAGTAATNDAAVVPPNVTARTGPDTVASAPGAPLT